MVAGAAADSAKLSRAFAMKKARWRRSRISRATPDPVACEACWRTNIPPDRVIETDEIAHLVALLLSDRASAITGSNMEADAGMTSLLVSRESTGPRRNSS